MRARQSCLVFDSVPRSRTHESDVEPSPSRQGNPGGATTGSPMMQWETYESRAMNCRRMFLLFGKDKWDDVRFNLCCVGSMNVKVFRLVGYCALVCIDLRRLCYRIHVI